MYVRITVLSGMINCYFYVEPMFATFKPKVLLTDRGKNFLSNEFERFLERHKVKHSITSSYHPECNGTIERVNGTVGRRIRLAL